MEARIMDLQQLFGQQVSYRIPVFQRPYAWTEGGQWAPLWSDVVDKARDVMAGHDTVADHFMGAVILQLQSANSGEVAKRIIVDGQQRLTTLQILIAAVRHCFAGLGFAEGANRLSQWVENDRSFWAGDFENQTKVRQSNLNDRTSFQDVIRDDMSRGQGRSIEKAYRYFGECLDEWINEQPDDVETRCVALEEAIGKHIKLATVDLDPDEKPHFIFAVLNARAELLKESDHIKNDIMFRANVIDDENAAREIWGPFDNEDWWRGQTDEGRLVRIHLDRFLHYWTSMKTVREFSSNQVYVHFKKYMDEESRDALFVASNIRDAGRVYRRMIDATQPGIEMFLRRLWTMELGVAMPLLMYVYTHKQLQDDDCKRVTQILESFLVRRMLVGLSSNGLNRVFFDLINRLRTTPSTDVPEECARFFAEGGRASTRTWPSDSEIRDSLVGNRMKGTQRRKVMVLEAIERHIRRDGRSEEPGNLELSLEHIMPERWESEWPLSPESTRDVEATESRNRAIQEIGNLTLVTGKLNSALSNSAWSEKRNILSRYTTLRLNRELLDEAGDSWNERAIKARSEWMVSQICEIWPHADKI